MRRLLVGVALVGISIGGAVGLTSADPGLNNIPAHRHFVNGQEVGPRLCDNLDNAGMQKAFNQFHANHHNHNVTGGQGPIAPGLHNGKGGELTPGQC